MTGKRLKPSNYDKNGDIIPSGWEDNKMTNKEAIEILTNVKNTPQITWTNGADIAFDLAIKALNLVSRLYGFKYVTTEVLLREHEVAHFDIYKRGWNDAIQAVIDASDMPVTDIIKAIKENELKEAENDNRN